MAFESCDIRWIFYRPSRGRVACLAHVYAEPYVSLQASLPESGFERIDFFGVKVVYGRSRTRMVPETIEGS